MHGLHSKGLVLPLLFYQGNSFDFRTRSANCSSAVLQASHHLCVWHQRQWQECSTPGNPSLPGGQSIPDGTFQKPCRIHQERNGRGRRIHYDLEYRRGRLEVRNSARMVSLCLRSVCETCSSTTGANSKSTLEELGLLLSGLAGAVVVVGACLQQRSACMVVCGTGTISMARL